VGGANALPRRRLEQLDLDLGLAVRGPDVLDIP
jgi:hypothetical protein